MKLSRRELIMLSILIILGLGILYQRFVYDVQQNERDEIKTQLAENRAKLLILKGKQGEEEKFLQKTKDIDLEIKDLERRLPYIKDVPGLLVELYYSIIENNLNGKSISFSKVTEEKNYNYFNVSFEANGRKEDVYNFFTSIENFKREVSIANIDFKPEGDQNLLVKLTLKVYLLKDARAHREPSDYDFMEGRYGTFKNLFDMFKSSKMVEDRGVK